ncbi:MAG: DUF4338 domain-containing protein, partial [Halobacteria archaeon]|nr:DUF4338 domain-containing protein [Halobacteria archaeon]
TKEILWSAQTQLGAPIECSLDALGHVNLEVVTEKAQAKLWNEYVDRYHYLGYRHPLGASLKYFIVADRPDKQLLGCLLFSASVWHLADRDRWIGWDRTDREKRLNLVINNSRFLIFPWVHVPNLASHVLSRVSGQIRDDWHQAHAYRPVLIETFVDTSRYSGTCYQAANWACIGQSSGKDWQGLSADKKGSIARKKLDENIFSVLNQRIIEACDEDDSAQYHWFNHRLFAVDGSKLNLPRELIDCGYKRPSAEAHYPQGLLSCLYELKSNIPYDFDLASHANERRCALAHLKTLMSGDVVVYDRGYFSYAMLYYHVQFGIYPIFRLQKNTFKAIDAFRSSQQTDQVITLLPSKDTQRDIRKQFPDIDFVPLPLRLVKYALAGHTY